jgi:hypothetical protein
VPPDGRKNAAQNLLIDALDARLEAEDIFSELGDDGGSDVLCG